MAKEKDLTILQLIERLKHLRNGIGVFTEQQRYDLITETLEKYDKNKTANREA